MSKRVLVIGGGGHAKVVIELLQESGYEIPFCITAENFDEAIFDIPILKGDFNLGGLYDEGFRNVFVAIGNNAIRAKLIVKILGLGFQLVNAIGVSAKISPSAKLGNGIAIMNGVIINALVCIGDGCIVNTGATIDHDCNIGEMVHVGPHCGLAGNVLVGVGAFLGIGAVVKPGVLIGSNAVLGAGSVVISDIPANVIAFGVPAKVMQQI